MVEKLPELLLMSSRNCSLFDQSVRTFWKIFCKTREVQFLTILWWRIYRSFHIRCGDQIFPECSPAGQTGQACVRLTSGQSHCGC